jgi:hypothetical protein
MESSRAEGTFSLTRGQNFMLGITKTTWHYCSKAHTDRAVNSSGTPRKLLANYPLPSLWSSYSIFFMTCDVHDSKTISQISLHYASEVAISLLPWLEKKKGSDVQLNDRDFLFLRVLFSLRLRLSMKDSQEYVAGTWRSSQMVPAHFVRATVVSVN